MADRAIVLVDDDKTILDCLQEQLQRMFGGEYLYETAESVEEAWEIIDELEHDGILVVAVVSDWLMPGVRGDEFLITLRIRKPAIARVLLTGQADASAMERARVEGGAHGVISKPWSAETLREVLVDAIAA